jgi:hypothetical protein
LFFRAQLRNLTQAQKGYTAKWTERQEEQKRKEREDEERRLAEEEERRLLAEREEKRKREEEEERQRREVNLKKLLFFKIAFSSKKCDFSCM